MITEFYKEHFNTLDIPKDWQTSSKQYDYDELIGLAKCYAKKEDVNQIRMEKELNYLSEKIEYIKESINVGEGIDLTKKDIEDMDNEKIILEDILNKLTEIAIT